MERAHRRLVEAASASPETEVESLGQRVSTQWFFNDVRAVVLAVRGGWSAAREAFADGAELDALATHGEAFRALGARRTAAMGGGRVARAFGQLPADPLHVAALLSLTVAILDDPQGQTTLVRLLSGLSSTSTAHIRLREHTPHCSPAMSAVIRASVRVRHHNVGQPALFPQPATHQGRLDPHHPRRPIRVLGHPARRTRRPRLRLRGARQSASSRWPR
ncbi:hypothetical protein ABZS83_11345 [Streptomyces sp. NPDC005426]|uniref:hypothetical protein n=1 Tax=Streptomyces sp. NPDC005426 TaxID=3155344 RepID=UPI0033B42C0A